MTTVYQTTNSHIDWHSCIFQARIKDYGSFASDVFKFGRWFGWTCTKPRMDKIRNRKNGQNPNGKNPERTKFQIGQNPEKQNPELDKIPNGRNPELDKIYNGKNPELDKIQNRKI